MATKLDFRRAFPEYYAADPEPHVVRFGAVPYLTLEGKGKPGGAGFQEAIQAIYSVGYGVKFAAKAKGQDFTMPALEAQWWGEGDRPLDKRMQAHAAETGLAMAGRHHEIYLNDPRRVGESKAKTILRWPVAGA